MLHNLMHHLLALEDGKDVFDTLLKHLITQSLYLLAKTPILKTRMILQFIIAMPSIYFMNKICLLILLNASFGWSHDFYMKHIVYVFLIESI